MATLDLSRPYSATDDPIVKYMQDGRKFNQRGEDISPEPEKILTKKQRAAQVDAATAEANAEPAVEIPAEPVVAEAATVATVEDPEAQI